MLLTYIRKHRWQDVKIYGDWEDPTHLLLCYHLLLLLLLSEDAATYGSSQRYVYTHPSVGIINVGR